MFGNRWYWISNGKRELWMTWIWTKQLSGENYNKKMSTRELSRSFTKEKSVQTREYTHQALARNQYSRISSSSNFSFRRMMLSDRLKHFWSKLEKYSRRTLFPVLEVSCNLTLREEKNGVWCILLEKTNTYRQYMWYGRVRRTHINKIRPIPI